MNGIPELDGEGDRSDGGSDDIPIIQLKFSPSHMLELKSNEVAKVKTEPRKDIPTAVNAATQIETKRADTTKDGAKATPHERYGKIDVPPKETRESSDPAAGPVRNSLDEFDDSDNEPLSVFRQKNISRAVRPRKSVDESSIGKDTPLCTMVDNPRRRYSALGKNVHAIKSAPIKKVELKRPSPDDRLRNPSKKRNHNKYLQQEASEALYKLEKAKLVQNLLCRWWYAVEWPPEDELNRRPDGFQELDGFPGAYICVKGSCMGAVMDYRQQCGKPTFFNFFAMPSSEIRDLLITAYTNQIEELRAHEGDDHPLLSTLRHDLVRIKKVDTEKADRTAEKSLKDLKKDHVGILEDIDACKG